MKQRARPGFRAAEELVNFLTVLALEPGIAEPVERPGKVPLAGRLSEESPAFLERPDHGMLPQQVFDQLRMIQAKLVHPGCPLLLPTGRALGMPVERDAIGQISPP